MTHHAEVNRQDASQFKPPFDREGYVIVRSLLGAEEFARLQAELDRYIRDIVPGLPTGDAFYDGDCREPNRLKQLHRMDQDSFFAQYQQHRVWRNLAETLLGEAATADAPEWFNKPSRSLQGTPPHQDNYYFCLEPCQVVTIWMALDVVDDENACLRYVPGSHLHGVRPHSRSVVLGFSQSVTDYGPDDVAREVAIHLQPGDVVAHHGNLIHRAEPNRSATRQRRAFAMVFRGASCRRDERAFARYQAELAVQQSALA